MGHVNVEIKAACRDTDRIRRLLRARHADFRGTDRQVDTYFRVPKGRLKLREGRIENHLIHYDRPNDPAPKRADVLLLKTRPSSPLREILVQALGVLVAVEKRREIYFVENVKFHIDEVTGLGSFVEIEAQAEVDSPSLAPEKLLADLHAQCRTWCDLFGIVPADLVAGSYSDMLLGRGAAGEAPPPA